jgi:hypothetical protein
MLRHGRGYRVSIELKHAGGAVPSDATDALREAIAAVCGEAIRDMSVMASSHDASVVAFNATVRESNSVKAIAMVDGLLDRCLLATGLFEEFDATGKVIRVAPVERAEGI